MSKGMIKLAAGAAFLVAVAAILILLTQRAWAEGRMTHCRNNLRQLGVLAHGQFAANYESLPSTTGRAFWQSVREFKYYDSRNKKWLPAPPLNPFACPLRQGSLSHFEIRQL